MKSGSKKILIIAIIIIVVLAIVGTALGFALMSTDMLKSEKDMFSKYFMQNIDAIKKLKNSNTYNIYKTLNEEGIYESNVDVKVKYSEGGEISNPINDLSAQINTKKDITDEYLYSDAQILFKGEEYIECELIRQKDIAGIRFSDVVKQFITVRDDENKEKIAKNLEISQSELEDYLEVINGTENMLEKIITTEEINTLKEKYVNMIKETFDKATYKNLKKVMITVNNNTIDANAYSVYLSAGQVGDMVIQILESIKTDDTILNKAKILGYEKLPEKIDNLIGELSDYEEFNDLKITVYQQKGLTVRTEIDLTTDKIIIENNQNKIYMQRNILNKEKEQTQMIEIIKNTNDNEEIYNVNINIVDGENQNTINIVNEMQNSTDKLTINTELKYISGIKEISVTALNTINKLDELTEKLEIDANNNVTLNDIDEERMKNIINSLKEKVPEKINIRISLLKEVLGIKETTQPEKTEPNEYEMTQVEINRFNAKFEFYTGETVSAENVKTLLGVVKSNLNSLEITDIEEPDGENNPDDVRVNIKLNIEKDKENTDLINQVLEKIKEEKKYKVSITYKQDNELIESINIMELKD